MANPLYSITISRRTYDVTPFEGNPETYLDDLSSEKIAELKSDYRKHLCSLIANKVSAVSLVVFGFPFAVAGEVVTGLLFLPSLCFLNLKGACVFATLPMSFLSELASAIWRTDGQDHHDYSIPQVRKEALEALRSPYVSFDKNKGYCWSPENHSKETEYYDFENLQKLGLLTDQDQQSLKALKSEHLEKFEHLEKKDQFVIQKFPFYVDWSSGSKKNVYLNKNELAAVEATDLAVNIEEIKETISSLSKNDIEYSSKLFHSQDSQYLYAISAKKKYFLEKYFAITAIKKICQEQNLNHIEIPPVKLIEIEIDRKTYTVLAQKNFVCSLNSGHQPSDEAVNQLLQVVLQVGENLAKESRVVLDNKNFAILAHHIDTSDRNDLKSHATSVAFMHSYFKNREDAWKAAFNRFPKTIQDYLLTDSFIKKYVLQ